MPASHPCRRHLRNLACDQVQTRKNDIAMTNEAPPSTSDGTDQTQVVAQLSNRWRVTESHDGLQWIIQNSRLNKGAMRWYGLYHLRSKTGLLRYVGELEGQGEFATDPAAFAALTSLPAWIKTRNGKA